jgi:hypothetical protein
MTTLDLSHRQLDDDAFLDIMERYLTLQGLRDWNRIENLNVSYNRLTFLPDLTLEALTGESGNLRVLDCSHNQITTLNSLPSTLEELNCSYNQLTFLSSSFEGVNSLPSSLYVIVCNNNQLLEYPFQNSYTNIPVMRIENNPISEDLYRVDSFDISDIRESYISNIEPVPILTLKKGTVLFHTFETLSDLKGMFLGFPYESHNDSRNDSRNDSYNLHPEQQVFFLLHPFNIQYGFKTLVLVLQNDVEVFMGIDTSTLIYNGFGIKTVWNKKRILEKLYTRENCNNRYMCRKPEVIESENQVMGYIAHDLSPEGDASYWHGETKDFLHYYPYVSYYRDGNGVLDRPEVSLYPRKDRTNENIIVTDYSDHSRRMSGGDDSENIGTFFQYIREHENEFNYKILDVVDNNIEYQNMMNTMNEWIQKGMYRTSEGLWMINL